MQTSTIGPSQSHSRGSDDPSVKLEIRLEAPIGEATFYFQTVQFQMENLCINGTFLIRSQCKRDDVDLIVNLINTYFFNTFTDL